MDQLSESYTKVSRNAINLEIVIIIRLCMADELNGASLARSPYKTLYNLQFSKWWHVTVVWSVTLKIGALTKLGLSFQW